VQTSTPAPNPWNDFLVQTASGIVATVVGGLILAGVVLAISIANKKLRKAIWGNVAQFFGWLGSIRITTKRRIEASREEGRSEIRDQVAKERESIPQPQWDIRPYDEDPGWFMLRNFGDGVRDIFVTAPTDQFVFDGSAHWDYFGEGVTETQFEGHPLPAGRQDGVTFTVTWRDANGDSRSRDVFCAPDGAAYETPARAYRRGWQDRQDELNHERAVPLKQPRWVIIRDKNERFDWLFFNAASSDVVANHVRITVDREYFDFMSSADWDSFPGQHRERFSGRPTDQGHMLDIPFLVEWSDVKGDRQSEIIKVKGGGASAIYGLT
jgi:hypothetical protein